mmetsp:Transcript_34186/g.80998  ORF Transcript_34186/g.80998 Transcript_34186/m.80998 type:complete len:220 (+) Transcript_34186:1160-1819(+)
MAPWLSIAAIEKPEKSLKRMARWALMSANSISIALNAISVRHEMFPTWLNTRNRRLCSVGVLCGWKGACGSLRRALSYRIPERPPPPPTAFSGLSPPVILRKSSSSRRSASMSDSSPTDAPSPSPATFSLGPGLSSGITSGIIPYFPSSAMSATALVKGSHAPESTFAGFSNRRMDSRFSTSQMTTTPSSSIDIRYSPFLENLTMDTFLMCPPLKPSTS